MWMALSLRRQRLRRRNIVSLNDLLGDSVLDSGLIIAFHVAIVENAVKLKLNIIDTPGYGDLLNNDGCWEPITRYVGRS
jgi:septin family protein